MRQSALFALWLLKRMPTDAWWEQCVLEVRVMGIIYRLKVWRMQCPCAVEMNGIANKWFD